MPLKQLRYTGPSGVFSWPPTGFYIVIRGAPADMIRYLQKISKFTVRDLLTGRMRRNFKVSINALKI